MQFPVVFHAEPNVPVFVPTPDWWISKLDWRTMPDWFRLVDALPAMALTYRMPLVDVIVPEPERGTEGP